MVVVRDDLLDQVSKLANIWNRAGINLVKERYLIGLVKSKGNIDDRQSLIVLRMAELNEIQVARLRIFIRRVIGNVDALLVILLSIPVIEKVRDLVAFNAGEESGDRTVAQDSHVRCKERMAASVIRVVLPSVVFRDDQVGREIKNEAGLVAERRFKQLVEPVLLDDGCEGEISPRAQRAAAR